MLVINDLCAGILSHINIEIAPGTCTAICGPSGSGKTTLLNAIAGYQIYQGSIYYQNKDIGKLPTWKRPCRYLNQRLYLFPFLSIEHNLWLAQYGASLKRDKKNEHIILTQMGIVHLAKRYPYQISGGEQQRAALARALISQPSLILLDEPFSSLDWQTRKQLWDVVNILKKSGITLLMVTHEPQEALALADQIIELDKGLIIRCYSNNER